MDSQLLEYCHSDVDILLNVCLKFRKLFMDITGPHHPINPFEYITITSLCMGTFRAKFLPKEWVVLYKKDARDKGIHRIWVCKCPWVKARKMHDDAPIEVYVDEGSWVEAEWENIATHRFLKCPIGIIPSYGYARRDNYSIYAMEWILMEEKKLQEKSGNKGLKFNTRRVTMGRRRYPTGTRRVDDIITTWMVTLWINVVMNMPMNLMDAGITVAHTVSLEIGRHYMLKEKVSSNVT